MTKPQILRRVSSAIAEIDDNNPLGAIDFLDEIIDALKARAPAKTLPEPKRAERKAAKKESAREHRAAVRAAVMTRANGFCECGCEVFAAGAFEPLEMDHFFGRLFESPETCWALIRPHHRDKTENRPTAEAWRLKFRSHAEWHNLILPPGLKRRMYGGL